MNIWECVGKYFSESDIDSTDSVFTNQSSTPYLILQGNNNCLIKENGMVILHSSSTNAIQYYLDANKTGQNSQPCKITFKARISDYNCLDSNISVQFFDFIYLKHLLYNGTYSLFFQSSSMNEDLSFPVFDIINSKDWFNCSLEWFNNVCTVTINNCVLFNKKTSNIITTGESNSKTITNCDDSLKINLDLCDLNFYRVCTVDNYQRPQVKIVHKDDKLSVLTNLPYKNIQIQGDTVFRIKFTDIEPGTIIDNDISIDRCVFETNQIISNHLQCYKIYKDRDTGQQIKIKLYCNPAVDHFESSSQSISDVFHYYKNFQQNDAFIVDIDVVQNGINLSGRNIIWDNKNLINATIKTYII